MGGPLRAPRNQMKKREMGEKLFWAIQPLFVVARALGLAPFPLRYGKLKSTKMLVNYSRSLWVSAFLFSVFCLPDMVQVQLDVSTEKSVPINAYVNSAWWVMCVMLGVTGFACFFARRQRLHLVLLQLVRFDSCTKLRESLRYRSTRRLLLLNSCGLFLLVLLALVHQIYSLMTQALQDSNELTLLGLYWLLVIMVLDSQFFTLAWMVRVRFRLVNRAVNHLTALDSIRTRVPAIGMGERARLWGAFGGGKAMAAYVRSLASMDMSLFYLVGNLCDAFGPLLLVQTCSNLVQITFHIYYYVEEVMGLITADDTVYVVGDLAVWCLPYMIGIAGVLTSSHVTTKEADQTGVLVSEALLRVKDHQARRELRLFSHQLLHTKVRFTACGFFTLDFSLLTSMTAAVVTHLVILVQFQLAGKDNQSKCNCTAENSTALMLLPTTPSP